MKKQVITLLLFTFLFSSCKGQDKPQINQPEMKTIYEQKFDDISLQFIRNNTNETISWETQITEKGTTNSILLDEIKKNDAWKFQEKIDESPIDLYNIGGAYFNQNDSSLVVLYSRFGDVFINKYSKNNGKFKKVEQKGISKYVMSGGFGKAIINAEFIKIKDYIYFYATVGQTGIKNPTQLFVIKSSSLKTLKKIEFNPPTKIVKTVYLNDFGVSIYHQEKQKKSKNNLLPLLSKNMGKDFFYVDMPVKNEEKENMNSQLHNSGIEKYSLFMNENNVIDSVKLQKSSQFLNDAINSKVLILGHLTDLGQEKIIYFFTEESEEDLKIIRFDNYTSEWLFANYLEKNVN